MNKSEIIRQKNQQYGSGLYHGPLRYTNPCILFLNCDLEVLNKRLDERVDDMIKNGLLNELKEFYKKIKNELNG